MRSDGHSTGGAPLCAKIGRAKSLRVKNSPTKNGRAKTTRARHQVRRALNRGETPRRRQVKRALPAFHFKGASLAERLRAHVVVDPETGCHVWTSTLAKGGYGRVLVSAHRLAWELAHGPIPEGMLVLHKCDNPPCCNPEHLFIGTVADNMADKTRKKRARNGYTGKLNQPREPGGSEGAQRQCDSELGSEILQPAVEYQPRPDPLTPGGLELVS